MRMMSLGLSCLVCFGFCSCSEDNSLVVRSRKAAEAFVSEDGGKMPAIVREQQRHEQVRQNREWTPENQKAHPVEYCLAQQEKLKEYEAALAVSAHKLNMALSAARRKEESICHSMEILEAFSVKMKNLYREAEEGRRWPVQLNGFFLTREQLQTRIVDAHREKELLAGNLPEQKNVIALLDRRRVKIAAEQRKAADLLRRVQMTLNDLQVKKVTEGSESIADVLDTLGDSIDSLGVDVTNPDLKELIDQGAAERTSEEFEKIMNLDKTEK